MLARRGWLLLCASYYFTALTTVAVAVSLFQTNPRQQSYHRLFSFSSPPLTRTRTLLPHFPIIVLPRRDLMELKRRQSSTAAAPLPAAPPRPAQLPQPPLPVPTADLPGRSGSSCGPSAPPPTPAIVKVQAASVPQPAACIKSSPPVVHAGPPKGVPAKAKFTAKALPDPSCDPGMVHLGVLRFCVKVRRRTRCHSYGQYSCFSV